MAFPLIQKQPSQKSIHQPPSVINIAATPPPATPKSPPVHTSRPSPAQPIAIPPPPVVSPLPRLSERKSNGTTDRPTNKKQHLPQTQAIRANIHPLAFPERQIQDSLIQLTDHYEDSNIALHSLGVLRQAGIHHATLLIPFLGDLFKLFSMCMQSWDLNVRLATVNLSMDLTLAFGDQILSYIDSHPHSLFKQVLNASSKLKEAQPVVRASGRLLRLIAEKLNQEQVIRILQPYSEDFKNTRRKAKAAALLVIATYRIT